MCTDSPYFEQPVRNVTARVGRMANLTCVVENLGHYKVSVRRRIIICMLKYTKALFTFHFFLINSLHHVLTYITLSSLDVLYSLHLSKLSTSVYTSVPNCLHLPTQVPWLSPYFPSYLALAEIFLLFSCILK